MERMWKKNGKGIERWCVFLISDVLSTQPFVTTPPHTLGTHHDQHPSKSTHGPTPPAPAGPHLEKGGGDVQGAGVVVGVVGAVLGRVHDLVGS